MTANCDPTAPRRIVFLDGVKGEAAGVAPLQAFRLINIQLCAAPVAAAAVDPAGSAAARATAAAAAAAAAAASGAGAAGGARPKVEGAKARVKRDAGAPNRYGGGGGGGGGGGADEAEYNPDDDMEHDDGRAPGFGPGDDDDMVGRCKLNQ
jgi:hypothetical protein